MNIFFILFAIFVTAKADFVDTLNRCKVSDKECLKVQVQKLLTEVNTRGFPEYGVSPTDPFDLAGEHMKISDELSLKFVSGSMKGLKNVIVKEYELNLEKGSVMYDYTVPSMKFDINFNLSGNHPMLQMLIGTTSLDGYGHLTLKLENVEFQYRLPFKFIKKDDHIYFKILPHGKNFKYNFGNVRVSSDRFMINDQDFSSLVVNLGNSDWRIFMSILDKGIFDLIVRSYVSVMENVYEKIPDDKLFEDDLTPYL